MRTMKGEFDDMPQCPTASLNLGEKVMDLKSAPTKAEIEAVAAAMWDCDIVNDPRPSWSQLDPHMDARLKKEFRARAEQGLWKFLSMRSNNQGNRTNPRSG